MDRFLVFRILLLSLATAACQDTSFQGAASNAKPGDKAEDATPIQDINPEQTPGPNSDEDATNEGIDPPEEPQTSEEPPFPENDEDLAEGTPALPEPFDDLPQCTNGATSRLNLVLALDDSGSTTNQQPAWRAAMIRFVQKISAFNRANPGSQTNLAILRFHNQVHTKTGWLEVNQDHMKQLTTALEPAASSGYGTEAKPVMAEGERLLNTARQDMGPGYRQFMLLVSDGCFPFEPGEMAAFKRRFQQIQSAIGTIGGSTSPFSNITETCYRRLKTLGSTSANDASSFFIDAQQDIDPDEVWDRVFGQVVKCE